MNLPRDQFISFKHALSGIYWAVRSQANFRIQLLLAIWALILAVILKINFLEMAVLILTIFFVLICELINTSIEELTDLITTKWLKQAKIAKDVSAGMVLLASVGALFIAAVIFLPKILLLVEVIAY